MADFEEYVSFSFFDKLKEAFAGIIVGLGMFVVATGLLFWNEGRAVKRAQDLEEGASSTVVVKGAKVDSKNEGKLVHVTGKVDIGTVPTDSKFGVKADGSLHLERVVEMYQWKEKKETKKKGKKKKTKYKYEKVWSKSLIKSSSFKDKDRKNPKSMPYKGEDFYAKKVTLGDFKVSKDVIKALPSGSSFTIDKEGVSNVPDGYKVKSGYIFKGKKGPSDPKVGDVRISFKALKVTDLSVIAKQSGSNFESYSTKSGGSLFEVRNGTHSKDAMIQKAQAENETMTWILRVVGWFLMFFGIMLLAGPFRVVFEHIPLVGGALGCALSLFAGFVASGASLSVISVGWLFYRPLIGVPLCLAGVAFFGGVIFMIVKVISGRKQQSEPAPAS